MIIPTGADRKSQKIGSPAVVDILASSTDPDLGRAFELA